MENTIREILGLRKAPKNSEVGIEIEIEADGVLPMRQSETLPKEWVATHDGSLRGNSVEYVLKKPLSEKNSYDALDSLKEVLKKEEVKIIDSIRAGVHVHVNVQDLTVKQLKCFVSCLYILEEILVEWCGDSRSNNLFCLRNVDAPAGINIVCEAFRANAFHLLENNVRYSAINLASLNRYGTVELRSMRTPTDLSRIKIWVGMLLHTFRQSKEYGDVQDIIEEFSMLGPEAWVVKTLGNYYNEFKDTKDLEMKVVRGMRFAQDLQLFGS